MKARIIETGEIVDVIEWSHSVFNPRVYSITFLSNGNYVKIDDADEFEILPDKPDWSQIKIQAAIAAMQGMIANPNIKRPAGEANLEAELIQFSSIATEYADSLITELKKQNP